MATAVVLRHRASRRHQGLDWSSSDEPTALQTRIRSMVDKNIKPVNVIQVMLVRRILPCQSRTCHLWEFDPAEHQTLQQFFGTTHEDIWKVLFKASETWPKMTEDRGHDLAHPASSVSLLRFKVYPLLAYSRKTSKLPFLFFQGWTKRAEQIQCVTSLVLACSELASLVLHHV